MGMSELRRDPTILLFALLIPVFLLVSVFSSKTYDAHKQDFAAYWQAGHMILAGQDVYNSSEWIAERELRGTAPHSEPAFHYPLPFAVLFSPLALLPVQVSYTLWLFFQQTVLLMAVLMLLRMHPLQNGYLSLFSVAAVFIFRPAFSVIFNGQIVSLLLFAVVFSIRLFSARWWFWGGLVLSILLLKPSIGLPILMLTCVWFLFIKQRVGIAGVMAGGILFYLIGAAVNLHWVSAYLQVGQDSFSKYFGLHPTVWGLIDKISIPENFKFFAGILASVVVLGIELFFLWSMRIDGDPLSMFSSILPAGLLIAPYSWNHDQILLVVPLLDLTMKISSRRGAGLGLIFLWSAVILSIALVFVAYTLLHDVWSILNALVVWMIVLGSRHARAGHVVMNATP